MKLHPDPSASCKILKSAQCNDQHPADTSFILFFSIIFNLAPAAPGRRELLAAVGASVASYFIQFCSVPGAPRVVRMRSPEGGCGAEARVVVQW